MCPICPQSHACSQQGHLPLSWPLFPFHLFVVPLGPEFLLPDLPVHSPVAKVLGVGWGLSHHTHRFCPWFKGSEGPKALGIPLHGLSHSYPSGCEPEDAPEQPAAAFRLPGGQAVEAAAGNQILPWPRLRPQGQAGAGLQASRGWPLWGFVATASLGGYFLAVKLEWVDPGALEPSLVGGRELVLL